MASVHTLVDPMSSLAPSDFSSSPPFPVPSSSSPFQRQQQHHHLQQDDADLYGDDDGDFDDDDENVEHKDRFLLPQQQHQPVLASPPPAPATNFLSISHLISPTDMPSGSPSPSKKKDSPPLPQQLSSSSSISASSGTAAPPIHIPSPSLSLSSSSCPPPPPMPNATYQPNTSITAIRKDMPSSSSSATTSAPSAEPLDLLKENRQLRKKMEGLMSHNMQLMLGIKEREHKLYRQKKLLIKYRKALLRFFEENESGSSSDGELSNLSANESYPNSSTINTPTPGKISITVKKDSINKPDNNNSNSNNNSRYMAGSLHSSTGITITHNSNHHTTTANNSHTAAALSAGSNATHIRNSSPPSPRSPSPSPSFTHDVVDDVDEDSSDYEGSNNTNNSSNKKRKSEVVSLDDYGDDKKRRVSRKNALWTAEDDEVFQREYSMHGKSWKKIHDALPGKTREQVQSHGQYLIRIGKLEDKKPGRRKSLKDSKALSPPPPSHHHGNSNHHHHHNSSSNSSQHQQHQHHQSHHIAYSPQQQSSSSSSQHQQHRSHHLLQNMHSSSSPSPLQQQQNIYSHHFPPQQHGNYDDQPMSVLNL